MARANVLNVVRRIQACCEKYALCKRDSADEPYQGAACPITPERVATQSINHRDVESFFRLVVDECVPANMRPARLAANCRSKAVMQMQRLLTPEIQGGTPHGMSTKLICKLMWMGVRAMMMPTIFKVTLSLGYSF